MKFSALGLSEAVMKGISEARFTDCTPVQELVLPYSLANKDVMVQSKTGSGKTAQRCDGAVKDRFRQNCRVHHNDP